MKELPVSLSDLPLSILAEQLYYPEKLKITSPKTILQYDIAFRFFNRFLKKTATITDLNDAALSRFKKWLLLECELAPKTVNERAGRIIAMWNWLAKKRHVEMFPTVENFKEPRRVVFAWTEQELASFYTQAGKAKGEVCDVPAPDFFRALIVLLYDTGERIGAILESPWKNVDLYQKTLFVPEYLRKGKSKEMIYPLWDETIAHLKKIFRRQNRRIFERNFCESAFYVRSQRIIRLAGIEGSYHKIRASHASYTKFMGGDARASLDHESEKTTNRHYIDKRIAQQPRVDLPKEWMRA